MHDTQTHHGYILHHGTVLNKHEGETGASGIVMGDGAETNLDWVILSTGTSPKNLDTQNVCCNDPKIQTKRFSILGKFVKKMEW